MDLPPVSVVIPTLARPSLANCLRSIAECRSVPAEVIVVAQAAPADLARSVNDQGNGMMRVVHDASSGVASATNLGIRHAVNQVVAVTHDDCTVATDWIGAAKRLSRAHPGVVLTGRVLPVGNPHRVPSCKTDPTPHDFSGEVTPAALYPNNMVLPRDRFMAFGGFDERFGPREAAEDCDFAYRWLRAGSSLRYEPNLTVHHHDRRTDKDLARLYLRYGIGVGAMYGKHLRAGDGLILRFLAQEVRNLLIALMARRRGPSQQFTDRLCFSAGLPLGLVHGLRQLGPIASARLGEID